MDYHDNLATYVEEISDDFQSTFMVLSDNVLSNMLGMPGDFEELEKIVRKYIPDAELSFTKTNQLDDEYDIYLIELNEDAMK